MLFKMLEVFKLNGCSKHSTMRQHDSRSMEFCTALLLSTPKCVQFFVSPVLPPTKEYIKKQTASQQKLSALYHLAHTLGLYPYPQSYISTTCSLTYVEGPSRLSKHRTKLHKPPCFSLLQQEIINLKFMFNIFLIYENLSMFLAVV